jgi:hypothetical protein
MPTCFRWCLIYCATALRSRNLCSILVLSYSKPRSPMGSIPGGRVMLLHNRPEARGQRASDHSPATSASSGERPEHQSPEPSTLATHIGCGMVRRNGTQRTQQSIPKLVLRRAHHGLHAAPQPPWEVGVMRARAITHHRDCGPAENPRPPSQYDNSRAERKPVSPYVCRGTALRLSRDNHIGQSVAEDPSRLEFP